MVEASSVPAAEDEQGTASSGPATGETPRPGRPADPAADAPTVLVEDPAPVVGRGPAAGRRRMLAGRLARGLGELLITAGIVVALFLAYQLWVTDLFAARTQDRLHHQLDQAWRRPPAPRAPAGDRVRPAPLPPVDLGDGLAVLRVPRFGRDYSPVVVEGVAAGDLRRGPGHIPGTAMPGQLGNFVVSGHRTTYGKPFSRLDELKVGDPLVVEVRDRYYTYRVTGSEVVTPNRVDVTYPVPKRPGVAPTKDLITLTTCHPKFSASHRLIVYGELVDTTAKSAGVPPAVRGE
ncbi:MULTISPECIES: class E sortase [Frankia]|uniref:class E sortase n=1 Tax=Frankia TaxID=1854 RepID=UPI0007C7970E|nr:MULTISPECIES: class E sortase [Frankia]